MKIADILIFENEDFVVLNKPAGLLSIPDREGKEISLKKILQDRYGDIFTVHRLDKGTSGLIVFAKNEATHKLLSNLVAPKDFLGEKKDIEKIYLGLIMGSPLRKEDRIDSPIMEHPTRKGVMVINRKGKQSLTDYKVLEEFGSYSWVQFQIHTGRTHQIRVHMKEIGHPIACDNLYGDGKPIYLSALKHNFRLSKNEDEERPILNRLALHAYQLKFNAAGSKIFEFEAAIPKDLKATLQQLGNQKRKIAR